MPYVFDGNRIKADSLAKKAEAAIARRKWKTAERYASQALDMSPDCVTALLAAGRCQLLIRRIDRASEYFSRALSISPRTPVQKELGWISVEQGRLPTAILMLTDHLQRNASDYEAYNLLLKCFYLTDRFEAGESLAKTLMKEKASNECFRNNRFLCRLLNGAYAPGELEKLASRKDSNPLNNPFIAYNLAVTLEGPSAWENGKSPLLKSKLLFEEHRFGAASRAGRKNTLVFYSPAGARNENTQEIVTIGSLSGNDYPINDGSVSRRHCVIVNYPDDVWLYDLESSMGTHIDGERVIGRRILDGVHDVQIGRVRIRIAASSDLLI